MARWRPGPTTLLMKDEQEDVLDGDECEVCGLSLEECPCDEENADEFAPGAIGEYRY